MGKWIKKGGVSVQVQRPGKEKWTCDFGVEHFSVKGTCMCADAQVDDPHDGRDPRGFVKVRHVHKTRRPRTAGKTGYVYAMDRREARAQGLNPHVKSRRKAPEPNAPMWKMDNEQRRRAASRARSM